MTLIPPRSKCEPEAAPADTGLTDLHTKHRPADLEDVLGQDAVVNSLAGVLKRGTSHAFLFTGPSGTGKTTLGRIIAKRVGCDKRNVIEVDAATNSGIDSVREITERAQFSSLGDSPVKVYIFDEVHAFSKAAWQALLKSVEEPPPDVYFIFCTTEPGKVPATITTRCTCYDLKPVSVNKLLDLLERVREAEGYKTSDDVLQVIASKSDGSPRRALTGLAKCCKVQDRQEAAELMNIVGDEEGGEVVELCRAMVNGKLRDNWELAAELVAPLKDQNPESIRLVVCAYVTAVLLKVKGEGKAVDLLHILKAFGTPYQVNNGVYPVLLSVGRVVFD